MDEQTSQNPSRIFVAGLLDGLVPKSPGTKKKRERSSLRQNQLIFKKNQMELVNYNQKLK